MTLGINIPSKKLQGKLVSLEIRHLSYECLAWKKALRVSCFRIWTPYLTTFISKLLTWQQVYLISPKVGKQETEGWEREPPFQEKVE